MLRLYHKGRYDTSFQTLMKGRNDTPRKRTLSIVPTTEEVLRAFAFPPLPTIILNNDPVAAEEFDRDDLANALAAACQYNKVLAAKVTELQALVRPKLLRNLQL